MPSDPHASDFELLVERHSREIFAYLWRLLGGRPEAEDCLQETFLRAYRSRAQPKPKALGNPRAWLYRIATNTARNHLRSRSREAARSVDLLSGHFTTGRGMEESVELRERLEAVARAVEALPHKQRAALLLRKYQGLDYADVASTLDCTENAARANVYQALRRLRTVLLEDK